jgi:hypothetical protein
MLKFCQIGKCLNNEFDMLYIVIIYIVNSFDTLIQGWSIYAGGENRIATKFNWITDLF